MKFNTLLDKLKKKDINNVLFLTIEEHYYLKKILKILNEVCTKEELKIFYGEDSEVEDIINNVESYGLFSESRFAVLINPEKLKNYKKLANILNNAEKLTNKFLLISYNRGASRYKPFNKIKSKNKEYFKKIYERQTYKILKDFFQKNNKNISQRALNYFVEKNEENIDVLLNEADKLLTYIGKKKKVEINDIEELTGNYERINIFDILDSMRKKDEKNFYKNLEYITREMINNEVLGLLKMIYGELKKVLTVKENIYLSNNELGKKLGLHPFLVKKNKYKFCAKNISEVDIAGVLSKFPYAEYKIKLNTDPVIVMNYLFSDYF